MTRWHTCPHPYFAINSYIKSTLQQLLGLTLLPPAQAEALEMPAVPPLVSRWCNCPTHTTGREEGQRGGGSGGVSACGKAHPL